MFLLVGDEQGEFFGDEHNLLSHVLIEDGGLRRLASKLLKMNLLIRSKYFHWIYNLKAIKVVDMT